jgi:hypothetical protein
MNLLQKLLNLMPFFDAEGGAAGAAAPESIPSEPAAGIDLMDESDWTGAQEEADVEKAEGQPEPESQPEPEPKPETIPEKFKVKYNKQEVELSREQLLQAAQKGLDYDRMRETRDRYMGPIERLAQQAGLSTDQFLIRLDQMVKYNVVDAKKQEFIGHGMDENQAAYFAEMAYENEMFKNGQAAITQRQNERARAMQEMQERIGRNIADFETRFPDVDKLPDEVVSEIKKGESPVVAYQSYLIRENGKRLKAMQQNQKNRQIAAGPVKTVGVETSDPFLEGLMGG